MEQNKISEICTIFGIRETITDCREVTSGHINSTFVVTTDKNKWVVQKINMGVFNNPRVVMHNIKLVTEHIAKKNPSAAIRFRTTDEGKNYLVESGEFWRVYSYIPGKILNKNADNISMFNAGKAFGQFQLYLNDFDASQLKDTIADFHNTGKRFRHLFNTVADDPCGRASQVSEEIEFILKHKKDAVTLTELYEDGIIPKRVTHNDTKTNNVILDETTSEPKCVIDLDTVMPGLIVHDFGDAIRFGANTAAEDEKDLSKVNIDLELFKSFAMGFITETKNILTQSEKDNMVNGAITITLECGIRFLDDYLSGDTYFKTDYKGHNLVRARNQFKLAQSMLEHKKEMEAIIKSIV